MMENNSYFCSDSATDTTTVPITLPFQFQFQAGLSTNFSLDSPLQPYSSGISLLPVPYFNDNVEVFDEFASLNTGGLDNFNSTGFTNCNLPINTAVYNPILGLNNDNAYSLLHNYSLNFEDNCYNDVSKGLFNSNISSTLQSEIPNEMPFICNDLSEEDTSSCSNTMNDITTNFTNLSFQPLQLPEQFNSFIFDKVNEIEELNKFNLGVRFTPQRHQELLESTPVPVSENSETSSYFNLPQPQLYLQPELTATHLESDRYTSAYPQFSDSKFQYIRRRKSKQKEAKNVEKPVHKCTYCTKVFPRPSALKTHINSHTGDQPFECTYTGCNLSFSVLSNLKRHIKLHPKWELNNKFKIKMNKSDTQPSAN